MPPPVVAPRSRSTISVESHRVRKRFRFNVDMPREVKVNSNRRHEWSTPEKNRVRSLAFDSGWSQCRIARHCGIPRSTIQGLLESEKARRDGRDRPGRPCRLTSQQVDQLIELVTSHGWQGRTYTWEGLAKESGFNVRIIFPYVFSELIVRSR